MPDRQPLMETLEARARRRDSRRDFFAQVVGAAAVGATAIAASAQAQTTPSPTPTATFTEADVLNFALNLEYLEANYYAFATTGAALAAADIGGSVGTAGTATGGRAVTFSDPLVAQYAREIAADELAHVRFLRSQFSDVTRVAQPAIDLGTAANGAFSNAARAAGLVGAGVSFDPYASDENFLLGAFLFEDVGVTAYKGAAPLLSNATYREAAAGILAAEAYHASIIRSVLYRKGLQAPSRQLIEATTGIAQARDRLDGAPTADPVRGIAPNDDQGIAPTTSADGDVSNIMPLNENGIAYSRSAPQVLNIVYLNAAAVSSGGFFPAGVNGNIKTSAASG
ncbi:ferritin-like domain-containing protein [Sphingomonas sp. BK235]|uniref:ferritin-like domain-containing protein n=1 Tax=Sphingomonas sp. BK235 TaxID=2512131 RepID=UPI00104F56A5|nr:ferritin-like domain-containing protein [Sphingomonas sp. BK235]TCP35546.1 ferritin-like protein [Sphingomonas sp. BK235]